MRIHWKILVVLLIGLLAGCAGQKKIARNEKAASIKPVPPFNPKAVEHFIQGSTFELLEDYKSALLEFSEALLYDSSSVTIYAKIAEQYLRLDKVESAKKILKNASRRFPDDVEVHSMLASLYFSQRDLAAAEVELKKVIELDPEDIDARNYLITIYITQHEDLKVAAEYEKIIELGYATEELIIKAGDIYLNRKMYKNAEQLFNQLLTDYPEDERSFLAMAKLSLAKKDTSTAIQWYQKGIKKNLAFDTCIEELRDLYIKQKNWANAINLLNQAIQQDSSTIENYLRLGELYYQKGDTSTAVSQLEKTALLFPDDFRAPFSLGRIYLQEQNWELAEKYVKSSIELNEEFEYGWMYLGFIYVRMARLPEAEATFKKAVELFPDVARLHYLLGSVLQQQQKTDEAILPLEKALDLEPDNLDAMSALAMIYDGKKLFFKSDSLYEEALSKNPDDPLLLNNYSYSLSERGIKLDAAKQMSEKAVAADSTNGAYLDTLGWIYFKLGNYQTALKYISRATEVRDNSAEVWEHLGDVFEKLNDPETARKHWQKSWELDKSRDWLLKKIGEN